MGRVGEFTDYEEFFTQLPAGIFVGGALFVLAITILIVSAIFQTLFRRCCQDKETSTTGIEEVVHVTNEQNRRSFENPVYTHEMRNKHTSKEQDITVRISQAHGYLAIENHDYENAAHLKRESEAEPEDYENLKDQNIIPPPRQAKPDNNTTRSNDRREKRPPKSETEVQSNIDPLENYDRPPKPKVKHVREPTDNGDSDDATPTYDVPKTFLDDNDGEQPDYDVPRSFTG